MKHLRFKKIAAAALLAAAPVAAWAQKDASQFLQQAESKLQSYGNIVATVVQIIIGLAAIVSCVMIFIESNKGQNGSKDKFITLAITLVVAFFLIEIVKAFVFG